MATFVQGRRCFTSVREQQQRQRQQRFIVRLSAGEIPAKSRERSPWMVEEKTSCRLWRTGSHAAPTVLNWLLACSYVQSWKSATLRREAMRRARDRKMVAAPPQSFAFS